MKRELSHLYFDGDVVVVELSLNGTHQGALPMGWERFPLPVRNSTSRASMSSMLRMGR
jgi:hypothetical protein